MKTSVLIRARNESKWLPEALRRLAMQSEKDFEVVVVDSGSTDATREIARDAGARVIEISAEDFTLPHALNVAASAAHAEDFFVIMSAHSLPAHDAWLASGLQHFSDPSVAGVYGPVLPMPGATIADRVMIRFGHLLNLFRRPGIYRERTVRFGTLGFTNTIIRKKLWDEYHFNEAYANGSEDADWARHVVAQGYTLVYDRAFSVHHSHFLSFWGWYQQIKYWKSTFSRPSVFAHQKFRHDGAHKPLTK